MRRWTRQILRIRPRRARLTDVCVILLGAGAMCCNLLLPPLVAFQPQPLAALALTLLGTLLIAPSWFSRSPIPWIAEQARAPTRRVLDFGGAAVLWGVVSWCVFSQEAPLRVSRLAIWGTRALPLVVLLALWLGLQLRAGWLRRGLLGVALPAVVALALVAWPAPPRVVDFAPYYLALDSRGTLYASDAHASVIRVFAPDGSLIAKLRPGLASRQGPPGPGFSPPGPYNDPDHLGVALSAPGSARISPSVRPWPVGADDFWFCGMATGARDRLFVLDWMRGRLLRFASDGRLEASVALPSGYSPSLGCVTAAGAAVYLADTRGTILQLDAATGHLAREWALGEPILGGVSATPAGDSVFALARSRVYRLDPHTGALTSWSLPAPSSPLGQPYQAILAPGGALGGRVFVANLAARRVDVYSATGRSLGAVGRPGAMPGEFGQVGGLARDAAGRLYVADGDSRAVQRFTPAGRINALYWGRDDDEVE